MRSCLGDDGSSDISADDEEGCLDVFALVCNLGLAREGLALGLVVLGI